MTEQDIPFKEQDSVHLFRIDTPTGYVLLFKRFKNWGESRRKEHELRKHWVEQKADPQGVLGIADIVLTRYNRDNDEFLDCSEDILSYIGGIDADIFTEMVDDASAEETLTERYITKLETTQPGVFHNLRELMLNDMFKTKDFQVHGVYNRHLQSSFLNLGHCNGAKLITAENLEEYAHSLDRDTRITLIDKDLEGGMRKRAVHFLTFQTGREDEGYPLGFGIPLIEGSEFAQLQDHAILAFCDVHETNLPDIPRYRYLGGTIFQMLPRIEK